METEFPEVEVRKKRVKRFYLRIDRQGHISLTVPVRTSEETIRKILAEKADWIRVHYAKVCARAPEEHTFASGETVYLFGEPLTLRVSVGQGKARAERSGGELVLTLPAAKAEETAAREKLGGFMPMRCGNGLQSACRFGRVGSGGRRQPSNIAG